MLQVLRVDVDSEINWIFYWKQKNNSLVQKKKPLPTCKKIIALITETPSSIGAENHVTSDPAGDEKSLVGCTWPKPVSLQENLQKERAQKRWLGPRPESPSPMEKRRRPPAPLPEPKTLGLYIIVIIDNRNNNNNV